MKTQNIVRLIVAYMIAAGYRVRLVSDNRVEIRRGQRPARPLFVVEMNNNVVIDVGAGAYRDAADFLVDLLRFNSRCSAMRKTIKAMTSSDDAIERTWTWFQGAKTERTRRPHAQVLVESLRAAQLDDLEWRRVTDGVKKKAA